MAITLVAINSTSTVHVLLVLATREITCTGGASLLQGGEETSGRQTRSGGDMSIGSVQSQGSTVD